MNAAYPLAEVEPGEDALARLAGLALPDEDDRHVLAAAIAAEATVETADLMAGLLGTG
jgi:hypothetical protein